MAEQTKGAAGGAGAVVGSSRKYLVGTTPEALKRKLKEKLGEGWLLEAHGLEAGQPWAWVVRPGTLEEEARVQEKLLEETHAALVEELLGTANEGTEQEAK